MADKRMTVNIPFNTGAAGAGNAFGATDLLANFAGQLGRQPTPGDTIVRIRGYASLKGTTAGSFVQVHIGIMLIDEGQAAGTAPTISTDVQNLIWRLDSITSGRVAETAAGVFASVGDIYPIDSRGMRKITRNAQELRVLIGSGSYTWNLAGTVRVMLG